MKITINAWKREDAIASLLSLFNENDSCRIKQLISDGEPAKLLVWKNRKCLIQVSDEDLGIVSYHITSLPKNSQYSKETMELLPLHKQNLNNSFLIRFLNDNDIRIDFAKCSIWFRKTPYSFACTSTFSKIDESYIHSRLAKDSHITAAMDLRTFQNNQYGHLLTAPEILIGLDKYFSLDLAKKWGELCSPHLIKIETTLAPISQETWEQDENFYQQIHGYCTPSIAKTIRMLCGKIDGDSANFFAYYKKDAIITPSEIKEIIPITKKMAEEMFLNT